jgi:hypothetical protein
VSVRAQCAFGHEGNYTAYRLGWPSYESSITVNDSITFTIYNFFNVPNGVYNDTIVGKMNCTNNFVTFLPVNYHSIGWTASFKFYGTGIFNQDTLFANYVYIIWSSQGIDTSYLNINYKPVALSVENKVLSNSIKVFPNPIQNSCELVLPQNEEINELHLFSIMGNEVPIMKNSLQLDLNLLDSGIYTLFISTTDDKYYRKLLVKK